MKTQITRFSVHQNSKVFAIFMAINCLLITIPLALLLPFLPGDMGGGLSVFALVLMPALYAVLTYVMIAGGCLVYNFLFKFIGGIEFDTEPK